MFLFRRNINGTIDMEKRGELNAFFTKFPDLRIKIKNFELGLTMLEASELSAMIQVYIQSQTKD